MQENNFEHLLRGLKEAEAQRAQERIRGKKEALTLREISIEETLCRVTKDVLSRVNYLVKNVGPKLISLNQAYFEKEGKISLNWWPGNLQDFEKYLHTTKYLENKIVWQKSPPSFGAKTGINLQRRGSNWNHSFLVTVAYSRLATLKVEPDVLLKPLKHTVTYKENPHVHTMEEVNYYRDAFAEWNENTPWVYKYKIGHLGYSEGQIKHDQLIIHMPGSEDAQIPLFVYAGKKVEFHGTNPREMSDDYRDSDLVIPNENALTQLEQGIFEKVTQFLNSPETHNYERIRYINPTNPELSKSGYSDLRLSGNRILLTEEMIEKATRITPLLPKSSFLFPTLS